MEHTPEQLKNMFDAPIPGSSLTSSPESPQAFEKPPEYTDLKDFIDDMFMNLTDEENMDGILDSMRKGIPVEDIAQLLLFNAFATGKITPDLQLLAIEPTIYLLLGVAEIGGVHDVVLYPEESMGLGEEEEIELLNQDGKRLEQSKPPKLNEIQPPEGISKSLINKLSQGA